MRNTFGRILNTNVTDQEILNIVEKLPTYQQYPDIYIQDILYSKEVFPKIIQFFKDNSFSLLKIRNTEKNFFPLFSPSTTIIYRNNVVNLFLELLFFIEFETLNNPILFSKYLWVLTLLRHIEYFPIQHNIFIFLTFLETSLTPHSSDAVSANIIKYGLYENFDKGFYHFFALYWKPVFYDKKLWNNSILYGNYTLRNINSALITHQYLNDLVESYSMYVSNVDIQGFDKNMIKEWDVFFKYKIVYLKQIMILMNQKIFAGDLEQILMRSSFLNYSTLSDWMNYEHYREVLLGILWQVEVRENTYVLCKLDEDGSFMGHRYETVKVSPQSLLKLAHPYHMTEKIIWSWRNLFYDYKIVQPFQQLERKSYNLKHTTRFLMNKDQVVWEAIKKSERFSLTRFTEQISENKPDEYLTECLNFFYNFNLYTGWQHKISASYQYNSIETLLNLSGKKHETCWIGNFNNEVYVYCSLSLIRSDILENPVILSELTRAAKMLRYAIPYLQQFRGDTEK